MTSFNKKIKKINIKRKALRKLMKRKRIQRRISASLQKRHSSEKRFKVLGFITILISLSFLVLLIYSIFSKGYTAFIKTELQLSIFIDSDYAPDIYEGEEIVKHADYRKILKNSLRKNFVNAKTRKQKKQLYSLISKNAPYALQDKVNADKSLVGKTVDVWFTASSNIDMLMKGKISRDVPEDQRKISDLQISWMDQLEKEGKIRKKFNNFFLTKGDSREAEIAGMAGSIIGSIFIIITCIFFAFPIGVMTAIYLEEFAPKNKITYLIEININNLAAVPSIVYGLLGLTIYLQFFDLPRSSSLVGGLTLSLMALPVIVISTRTAIAAIPSSIRDGAMALGATDLQIVMHHIVPLALPGIMTGAILSIARVIGETAPLLMIGMVAFLVDIPTGFMDASTAMPVQIYLWSDNPELGFVEKTSAAIMVLLTILISINSVAVFIRKKFETRW